MDKVKVAILGAGFIIDIHMESYHRFVPDAQVVAVYARKIEKAKAFAHKYQISAAFDDIDQLLTESGCEVGAICWAKHGGVDDRSEICGTGGVIYADFFMGNSAESYSKSDNGNAMEKGDTTVGWSFTVFEEAFNQGYPHELPHFIECVKEEKEPLVTGEDGRAVLEIIDAAYASAGEGKKISLPFHPKVAKPIDLWLGSAENI